MIRLSMNDDETAKHHQPRASSVSVVPGAHPASGAKIQQTKPPKQATKTGLLEYAALQRFTSGTWVLKPTSFSPTEDSFLAAVTGMGNALKVLPEPDLSGPKHVEIRKKLWMVELHSIEAARQLAGKMQMPPLRSAVKDWGPLCHRKSQPLACQYNFRGEAAAARAFQDLQQATLQQQRMINELIQRNTELSNQLFKRPPPQKVWMKTSRLVNLQATARASRWPVDFDRNGHIRAARTPEDPATIVYAYGSSEVLVTRGGIPLTGRAHAAKLGHLTLKMDESTKNTIAVLSSASFVKMY
ncbi:hypothetical protein N7465_006765 [Penicillium sp. CMV-2018d]|nr:hypothetical protein N7465_006765 [Penicillium sp. CMV-2018d]